MCEKHSSRLYLMKCLLHAAFLEYLELHMAPLYQPFSKMRKQSMLNRQK